MLFGKFEQFGAAAQIPFAPGGDDLDLGVQRVGGQFETHLVIALAGGAMGHGIGAGFLGDLNKALGNQGSRDRGAQQIQPLVDGIGAEHWEHKIAHEFFAQVFDIDIVRAHHLGFGAGWFQLFSLAKIGGEGHDLAAVFGLQPFENDRCIQTAGIGENDFFGCGHECFLCRVRRGRYRFLQIWARLKRVDPRRVHAY